MSAAEHEPVDAPEYVAFIDKNQKTVTIAPATVPDDDARRSEWITSDATVPLGDAR